LDINQSLKKMISYIEENICNKIEYNVLAQMLGMSEFHFQRMFSFLAGMSISEYVRRRKMALAAFDLKKTDEKIIDIAAKYGYDSHSAFSRTFQRYHGITPSMARKENVDIQTFPPLSFSISIKGNDSIQFRTEKKESFKLFGKNDVIVPMEHKYALRFILDYGRNVVANGTHDSINIAAGFLIEANQPFHLLHGVYFKDNDENTHFMYGWELPDKGVDESFTIIDVPEATWAVFTYHGEHLESLPKIWTYLYTDWFFTSRYEVDNSIVIEKETWVDVKHIKFFAEVWIPISESN